MNFPIKVITPKGSEHSLNVGANDTILSVKKKVEEKEGTPVADQVCCQAIFLRNHFSFFFFFFDYLFITFFSSLSLFFFFFFFQRLLLAGNELEDDKTLAHYKISFYAKLRLHGRGFNITIADLDGKSWTLEVESADTVQDLKDKFQIAAGVGAGSYRLMFGNDYLDDTRKFLSEEKIGKGDSLLFLPL